MDMTSSLDADTSLSKLPRTPSVKKQAPGMQRYMLQAPGEKVQLVNSQSQPQLNGLVGEIACSKTDELGFLKVRMPKWARPRSGASKASSGAAAGTSGFRHLKVWPKNLQPLREPSDEQPRLTEFHVSERDDLLSVKSCTESATSTASTAHSARANPWKTSRGYLFRAPGEKVELVNSKSQPHLNGLIGEIDCSDTDELGFLKVRVSSKASRTQASAAGDDAPQLLKVRPKNLQPLRDPADRQSREGLKEFLASERDELASVKSCADSARLQGAPSPANVLEPLLDEKWKESVLKRWDEEAKEQLEACIARRRQRLGKAKIEFIPRKGPKDIHLRAKWAP
eukprot:TRINITY_DN36981_c0_g1_i1.p1 TRINITY_DN36981_c0_g1~~TRINITY_DN36981_c0_g1_i1.p1  ORF type:complete len:357 (+),score=71.49 TRINITY_DN36981_c0_g1_i1:53-1072(+)